jgi:hypothetical protein
LTPSCRIRVGCVESTYEGFERNVNKLIIADAGHGSQPLKTSLTRDSVESHEYVLHAITEVFVFQH